MQYILHISVLIVIIYYEKIQENVLRKHMEQIKQLKVSIKNIPTFSPKIFRKILLGYYYR
jgi:hypothetical protein